MIQRVKMQNTEIQKQIQKAKEIQAKIVSSFNSLMVM